MYTFDLTAEQMAVMQAKQAAMKTASYTELIDAKVIEFVDACRRDVGQSTDTEISKRLAGMTDNEKSALLAAMPTKLRR